MDAWAASGSFQPVSSSALTEYAERYTYDPNGNILTLNRNGDSTAVSMDQLSYKYIYAKTAGGNGEYVPGQDPTSGVAKLTNQLSSIQDAVTGNSYAGDIKSQSAFNYTYDAIGELTGDAQQQISNITWNVYGKILSLSDSGNTISFTYDAAGNRISKTAHGITTWYVRDAQGNVMSVYTQGNSGVNSGALTQTEAHLYGSSRLGLLDLSVNCASVMTQPTLRGLVRGNKLFELTNHLGNVLETISDKKVQHTSDNSTVDYYVADVINATDYYSFGMGMPVRSFTAASAANYRFGFNGKEQDPEVKGAGDQYDYGMRMYDPRVGRFLSVDPFSSKYPHYSPFQFAGNQPIEFVDLDGLEEANPNDGIQSDALSINPRFRNTALLKPDDKLDVVTRVGIGMVKVIGTSAAIVMEIAGAAEYGNKVKNKKEAFPLTQDNLGYVAKGAILAPAYIISGLKSDPGNAELWGEAIAIIGGISELKSGAPKETAPDIALGLTEPMGKDPISNQPNPNALKQFSTNTGAVMYRDWNTVFGDVAASKTGFDDVFTKVVNHVIDNGGRVKFNLDHFDLPRAALDAGKSYLDAESITAWEFGEIIRNKKYFISTDFYKDGKVLNENEVNKVISEYSNSISKTKKTP